jgi:hypothetical protein
MLNSYLVEFIGTFCLVFTLLYFQSSPLLVSIGAGLVLGIFLFISSKYVNVVPNYNVPTYHPVIVFCHFLLKIISFKDFVINIGIELLAGLAALLLFLFIPKFKYNKK